MSKAIRFLLLFCVIACFAGLVMAQTEPTLDPLQATATQRIIGATASQAAWDGIALTQAANDSDVISSQSLQVTSTPEPLPFDPIDSDADTTADGTASASSQDVPVTDNTASIILAFGVGVLVGGAGMFIVLRVLSSGDKAKRG